MSQLKRERDAGHLRAQVARTGRGALRGATGLLALLAVVLLGACDSGTEPEDDPRVDPTRADALAIGAGHVCALDREGRARCWGLNSRGQLGNGDTLPSVGPVEVSGDHAFKSISAGWSTTCALTEAGEAWCWGANGDGQVGDGTSEDRWAPASVATDVRFEEIDVGYRYVCARAEGGRPWCWGYNAYGQLGHGSLTSRETPVPVASTSPFQSLTAGLAHVCGLVQDGGAYCWGEGRFGSLGTGDTISRRVPTAVTGGVVFRQLTAGATTTCGVVDSGAGYCWGQDYFGTLGTGPVAMETKITTPSPVAGGLTFASIHSAPANSVFAPTCGIDTEGATWCWGANAYGQLGTAVTPTVCLPSYAVTEFGCSGTSLEVAGAREFTVVRTGEDIACGIEDGGTDPMTGDTLPGQLYCWGTNRRWQLGQAALDEMCDPLGGGETPCTFEPKRLPTGIDLP